MLPIQAGQTARSSSSVASQCRPRLGNRTFNACVPGPAHAAAPVMPLGISSMRWTAVVRADHSVLSERSVLVAARASCCQRIPPRCRSGADRAPFIGRGRRGPDPIEPRGSPRTRLVIAFFTGGRPACTAPAVSRYALVCCWTTLGFGQFAVSGGVGLSRHMEALTADV
jgi:hypothetical protein